MFTDTLLEQIQDCLDAEVKRLTGPGWELVRMLKKDRLCLKMKKTSFGSSRFRRFITESFVGHIGFPDWQEFFHFKVEKRTVT